MADVIGAAARGGALALGVMALATLRTLPPAPSSALPQRAAVVAGYDEAVSSPSAAGTEACSHPGISQGAQASVAAAVPGCRRVETTSALPGSPPAADVGDRWALRSGGWYISVDGAMVPILSVSEQTAARPRSGLALTLSPFDNIIWYHANAEGLDWRLVAALIFEESGFNPTARSSKGAYGLMQVMPIAAEAVGAAHFEAPDDNVRAGVRYLRQLDEMFQQVGGLDRLKFVLAAYNMGPGHVRDAQALARRFGYDPYRWDDAVAVMLPLLEEPAIYETLPLGFARGTSTVAYVSRVLKRFQRYRLATPATTDAGRTATRG